MVIFIILTFFGLWLVLGNTRREPDWRVSFVQALIVWATYLTLSTEVLSLFNWVTFAGLSVVWITPCLVFTVLFLVGFKKGRILRFPIIYHLRSRMVAFMDILIMIIMLVTLVIAFVSPPNSLEAMTSRLPRVAHWAQQQNLGHFTASSEAQNSAAPGYEIILLNFFVLAKGDGWSNIITWLALFGCIEAIMGLAAMFGSTPKGTRLSAMFAVSLPIAIAQASSSLNDMVLTLWIMGCILMILLYRNDGYKPINVVLAMLSAGLAVVSKPTALIFLAPFLIYLLILLIKQVGIPKTLGWVLVSCTLILILSGGYLIRNQVAYEEVYSLDALEIEMNGKVDLTTMLSNVTRNTALQVNIPWERLIVWIEGGVESQHEQLDLSVHDPRTTVGGLFLLPGFNTSELTSGNPIHFLLITISFVTVFVLFFTKNLDWELFVFVCSILVAGILFNLFLKVDSTGSRLQMPFFFLFAPIVGFLLGKVEKYKVGRWVGLALFVFALPWIFSVKERPIFVLEGMTYERSIFTTKRRKLYFTSQPESYEFIRKSAESIKNRDVSMIGLDLKNGMIEYPLWAYLDAPNHEYQIENISTAGYSTSYEASDYHPEAILCVDCEIPIDSIHGLELALQGNRGEKLFLPVK